MTVGESSLSGSDGKNQSGKEKAMPSQPSPHKWTRTDILLYVFSMIPFVLLFLGATILLSAYSVVFSLLYIGLYLLTNVFQAGCCVGCPYRGRYCPAFCGVYLGNILSTILYADRTYNEKFFMRNATAGETSLFLFLAFPLYWLWMAGWYWVPIYLLLFLLHVVLFAPTQCDKCGYKEICPGGKAWRSCKKKLLKEVR
jgi:hypothetical protein